MRADWLARGAGTLSPELSVVRETRPAAGERGVVAECFRDIVLPRGGSRAVVDVCKRRRVARGEPWFYLRLGVTAGLTLFRVLQEGLSLDESLSPRRAGRNAQGETASRFPGPGL